MLERVDDLLRERQVVEAAEVDVGVRGVRERLDRVDERAHAHPVAVVIELVDAGVELGLVVEAETTVVDHLGALVGFEFGPDAEFVEDVLVRGRLLGGDAVAAVDDDRRARRRARDARAHAQQRGGVFAVVVRPAVDGVAVGLGDANRLAHHVGERREFLGHVSLPAVREPERTQRRGIGLQVENAPERLRRLVVVHVVGGLRTRPYHLAHQPLERPLAVRLGRLGHTRCWERRRKNVPFPDAARRPDPVVASPRLRPGRGEPTDAKFPRP